VARGPRGALAADFFFDLPFLVMGQVSSNRLPQGKIELDPSPMSHEPSLGALAQTKPRRAAGVQLKKEGFVGLALIKFSRDSNLGPID
jgi:hypothetical protein